MGKSTRMKQSISLLLFTLLLLLSTHTASAAVVLNSSERIDFNVSNQRTGLVNGTGLDLNNNKVYSFFQTGQCSDYVRKINPDGTYECGSDASGGSQNLSEVLAHGNAANDTIDMAENNITDADRIGIGTDTPRSPIHVSKDEISPDFMTLNTNSSRDNVIAMQVADSDLWWSKPALDFRRARGNLTNLKNVTDGDSLGIIHYGGYVGKWTGGETTAASIGVRVNGTFSDHVPGELRLATQDSSGNGNLMTLDAQGTLRLPGDVKATNGDLTIIGSDNDGSASALEVNSEGMGQKMLIDGNEIDSNGVLYLQNNNGNGIRLGGPLNVNGNNVRGANVYDLDDRNGDGHTWREIELNPSGDRVIQQMGPSGWVADAIKLYNDTYNVEIPNGNLRMSGNWVRELNDISFNGGGNARSRLWIPNEAGADFGVYDDDGTGWITHYWDSGRVDIPNGPLNLSGNRIHSVAGVNVTNTSSGVQIADFQETGVTLHQPLSVESSGAMSVANGIDLTDTTSNTIDSYSTFYLSTSSGTPSDIVLQPTGEVGVQANLDMAGNNITNCDNINGVDCGSIGTGSQNLSQVLAHGNRANTTVQMNVPSGVNDFIKVQGSGAAPHTLRFDDRDLRIWSGDGPGTMMRFHNETGNIDVLSGSLDMTDNNIADVDTVNANMIQDPEDGVFDIGDSVYINGNHLVEVDDILFNGGSNSASAITLPDESGGTLFVSNQSGGSQPIMRWNKDLSTDVLDTLDMNGNTIVYSGGGIKIGDSGTSTSSSTAVSIGDSASAGGGQAVALGYSANAGGNDGIAIGDGTVASGSDAVAIGDDPDATRVNTVAIGTVAQARGDESVALGDRARADVSDAIAIGQDSTHANNISGGGADMIAIGSGANASDQRAVALGYIAEAAGADSVAVGENSAATADHAGAFGTDTLASGHGAYAIGEDATASGSQALALGQNAVADDAYETVFGGFNGYELDVNVTGDVIVHGNGGIRMPAGVLMGDSSSSLDSSADTVIGKGATASGGSDEEVAIGYQAAAPNFDAAAFGAFSEAAGNRATAIGHGSSVTGSQAAAFGAFSNATGFGSISIGWDSNATSGDAISLGYSAGAPGDQAISIGAYTSALKQDSMALGYGSLASANGAIAIGRSATAPNSYEATFGNLMGDRLDVNVTGNVTIHDRLSFPNGVLIGDEQASINGHDSVGIGKNVEVTSTEAVGVGSDSYVEWDGVAIGHESSAIAEAVAVGEGADAAGSWDVAVGHNAQSYYQGTAVGHSATSSRYSVAIGDGANVPWPVNDAVAVGNFARVTANNSVAVGEGSIASGRWATAVGRRANASVRDGTAYGVSSTASGFRSMALGGISEATNSYSVAIGYNAKASNANEATFGNLNGDELDVNVTGGLTVHGSCTGCADIAELYNASEPVSSGEIVMADSEQEITVEPASVAGRGRMLGVVTTNPAILFEGDTVSAAANYTVDPMKPGVALVGRVPVNVSLENGPIRVGDPITVSSTAGVGMKATSPGKVVGTALQPYNASSADTRIMMFVNPQYHVTEDRFKELQAENQQQDRKIREQQEQIDELTAVICQQQPNASICE